MKKTKRKLNSAGANVELRVPLRTSPEDVKVIEVQKALAPTSTSSGPTRVCLELVNPGARRVFLAGSFNEWKPEKTPLVSKGDGRWVAELTASPGKYEYLFVVDGQWMMDPKAAETVQNPYGGRNAVLTILE